MSDIMKKIKARAAQGGHKYTWEDLKRLREEDEAKQAAVFEQQFKEHAAKETVGRSGILPLHMKCTVNNFEADTAEKMEAKRFAAEYIMNFDNNLGQGFIFSGNSGTGKNHLSAAMCNELMRRGKSCLVITVNELMQKLRNCYDKNSETTEDKFFHAMNDFDLLILDEIGLQRNNDNERLALNQIIDKRIGCMKPTGMLTNLPAGCNKPMGDPEWFSNMNDLLGVRIMDRMRSNGGKWISFNWESYRK